MQYEMYRVPSLLCDFKENILMPNIRTLQRNYEFIGNGLIEIVLYSKSLMSERTVSTTQNI